MRVNRKGGNPQLHLATYPLRVDPECWCILLTFKDARAFAHSDVFRQDLVRYASRSKRSNGPIGVLVARADRLGWQLQMDGRFQDSIGCFDLLSCAWEQVLIRVRIAWAAVIGAEVFHRSSLDGCHQTDLLELHRVLEKLDVTDQALYRNHLDGTLFTQCGRAHFEEENEGKCPWCPAKDGFYHRAWECPFFQNDRADVPEDVMQQIPRLPRCLTCHGWPVRVAKMDEWLGMLELIPEPDLSAVAVQQSPSMVNLFVDGSCQRSEEPSMRLASWAVTQAETIPGLTNTLLAAGPVPGMIQSAYRAELWALVSAVRIVLQAGVTATAWSDNAAVVDGFRKLLRRRRQLKLKPSIAHFDLWTTLVGMIENLRPNQIKMVKVVSHGDVTLSKNDLEVWGFYHNSLTDLAARKASELRPTSMLQLWHQVQVETQEARRIHGFVLQVHLRTSRRALESKPVPVDAGQDEGPGEHPQASEASDAQAGAVENPFERVEQREWEIPRPLAEKVGGPMMDLIHRWWTQVAAPQQRDSWLMWISGVQLFVDFMLSVRSRGPIYVNRKWLADDEVFQGELPRTFTRIHSFTHVLQKYWTHHGRLFPSQFIRPGGGAIIARLQCFRLGWDPSRIQSVDDFIYGVLGRQLKVAKDVDLMVDFPPRAEWQV